MRRVTITCTFLLSFLAAGCGGQIQSLLAPSEPPVYVTETFSGTVTRNGATSHPFAINSAGGGDVTAVLRVVTPDNTAIVGMSLGTWNGTACQAIISNDRATAPTTLFGRATSAGLLCVRIYDAGLLNDQQGYEIDVTHP